MLQSYVTLWLSAVDQNSLSIFSNVLSLQIIKNFEQCIFQSGAISALNLSVQAWSRCICIICSYILYITTAFGWHLNSNQTFPLSSCTSLTIIFKIYVKLVAQGPNPSFFPHYYLRFLTFSLFFVIYFSFFPHISYSFVMFLTFLSFAHNCPHYIIHIYYIVLIFLTFFATVSTFLTPAYELRQYHNLNHFFALGLTSYFFHTVSRLNSL